MRKILLIFLVIVGPCCAEPYPETPTEIRKETEKVETFLGHANRTKYWRGTKWVLAVSEILPNQGKKSKGIRYHSTVMRDSRIIAICNTGEKYTEWVFDSDMENDHLYGCRLVDQNKDGGVDRLDVFRNYDEGRYLLDSYEMHKEGYLVPLAAEKLKMLIGKKGYFEKP
jgi:hypothetical protein